MLMLDPSPASSLISEQRKVKLLFSITESDQTQMWLKWEPEYMDTGWVFYRTVWSTVWLLLYVQNQAN